MTPEEMLERMAKAWGGTLYETNPKDFRPNRRGLLALQAALRELMKEYWSDEREYHSPYALGEMVLQITELEL